MSLERISQLDAIATAAAGKPTRVYLDDQFPLHLRGLADYNPRSHDYVIHLNPVLLTWMRDALEQVFWHEVAHIKLNHVPTNATPVAHSASYRHLINHKPQTYNDAYYTVGAQVNEIAAEAEAGRLRSIWPYAAYSLWKLIQGREQYP
jgi:hypothetical protein